MKDSILMRSRFEWMGPSVMALMVTLSVVGVANAAPGVRPFQDYVTQGYTEVANYAAFQMGNREAAKHFHNKAQLAQSGGKIDPENPSSFTSRRGIDIAKARNLLLEVLASDQAKQNPKLAAVALVNFDCFVGGVGQDGIPCLGAFTSAVAALKPGAPAVTVAALQANNTPVIIPDGKGSSVATIPDGKGSSGTIIPDGKGSSGTIIPDGKGTSTAAIPGDKGNGTPIIPDGKGDSTIIIANVDGSLPGGSGDKEILGALGGGNNGNPPSSDQVVSDSTGSTGDGSNGRSSGSSASTGGSAGGPGGGASSGAASGGPGGSGAPGGNPGGPGAPP